jgi:hypothetical protein
MERMRMTNDFTLLGKLFISKKNRQTGTRRRDEGADVEDPRLNTTM